MSERELTIWKFPFRVADRFELAIPHHARILHVELQGSTPCIWAMLYTSPEVKGDFRRRFAVFGTGHPIPGEMDDWTHVGTFQQGPFVWHVFEDARHCLAPAI